jgi:tripartite-type tricarboxylate transporter receptor subunit TctC
MKVGLKNAEHAQLIRSWCIRLIRFAALMLRAADSTHAADLILVVPYFAGGPTGTLATRFAHALGKATGRSVEVRYQPEGGGVRAAEELSRSPKDDSQPILGELTLILMVRAVRQVKTLLRTSKLQRLLALSRWY